MDTRAWELWWRGKVFGNCLAAINLHSIHSLLLPTVLHFQDYKRKKQERNSDKDKEDIDDGCGWSLSSCLVPINNQFFYTSLLRILRLFSFIIFSNRWWKGKQSAKRILRMRQEKSELISRCNTAVVGELVSGKRKIKACDSKIIQSQESIRLFSFHHPTTFPFHQ